MKPKTNPLQIKVFYAEDARNQAQVSSHLEAQVNEWLTEMGDSIEILEHQFTMAAGTKVLEHGTRQNCVSMGLTIWYRQASGRSGEEVDTDSN